MKALEKKNCVIFGCVLMSYCVSWPARSTAVVMNCSVKNKSSCELESFAVLGLVSSSAFGASTGTAALCIYIHSCLNVTHLQVVTLECRVCCQVDLFIKGSNHRCHYRTVCIISNKELLGQLEITCFGAKNKEDCSSFFLSLGLCCLQSCCIFRYHLECHAQVTLAQAMSDLDKTSVAILALFIERCLPPWCQDSACLCDASFLFIL